MTTLDRRSLLALAALTPLGGAARGGPGVPVFSADLGAFPQIEAWNAAVVAAMPAWWVHMEAALSPRAFTARGARLIYAPLDKAAAVTVERVIYVNAPWVLAGNTDSRFLAHELAHVIQDYPARVAPWVKEGLADYLRYYVLFPADPGRGFAPDSDWRSGYAAAAALFDWLERARPGTVAALDQACREGQGIEGVLAERGLPQPAAAWQAMLAGAPPRPDRRADRIV